MNVFKKYADFYDSLYEDKSYQEECNFVKHVFETYSEKKVNSIIDLGCGTGSHAMPFTDMGYAVTGIDISENMLDIARKKVADNKKQIKFVQQDIKHLKLPQKFDVWFGPAVLTQKPTDRVKIIEQTAKKIIRYAHPVLNIMNHTVEVNYTVLEISRNKVLTETRESHLMRFFFYQELKYFLETSGFKVLEICPFMDLGGKVDETCWNISIICKKVLK